MLMRLSTNRTRTTNGLSYIAVRFSRTMSDWGHALKYSHAVMGFETDVPMSPYVINNFLVQAIDYDMTVYQAYRRATKYAFDDPTIIAAAIFDTDEQWNNDHLWGQGVVMPDEYPDDDYYRYVSWTCDL